MGKEKTDQLFIQQISIRLSQSTLINNLSFSNVCRLTQASKYSWVSKITSETLVNKFSFSLNGKFKIKIYFRLFLSSEVFRLYISHISSTCYCLSLYDHTIQTHHSISKQSFQTFEYITEDPHPSVESHTSIRSQGIHTLCAKIITKTY